MFDERKFRAQVVLAGLSMKDLAERLGIDEATIYRKINAGGAFSRSQINDLIEILNIDDPMSIFFAEKLAKTQD